MSAGSADAGRGGLHRGQARHDPDLDAGMVLTRIDRLEHGGSHGKDSRVPGGDDGDALAAGGQLQRMPGSVELDPVVGGVARLPAAVGPALEVRLVADQYVGFGEL